MTIEGVINMKCERCGSTIKKGELYCNKCGAKVKENLHNTIDIGVLKDKGKKDDDDIFYQKGLEKGTSPLTIFLIILVILLILGSGYLLYHDYKNKNTEKPVNSSCKLGNKDIYFQKYQLTVKDTMLVNYSGDKLVLKDDHFNIGIYQVSDNYQDIIDNVNELLLKWEELGIKIDEKKEIDANIYELKGTYQNKNETFYILNITNNTIIVEVSSEHNNSINQNEEILNIVKSIKLSDEVIPNKIINPSFNLDPIGSQ